MRSIAFLLLAIVATAALTMGMLSAQEQTDAGPATGDSGGRFAPSEAVKADTAVAFPTDI